MTTKHRGPHVWNLDRRINDYYCRYCLVLKAFCGTVNCEDSRLMTAADMPDSVNLESE